ncbi:hypothetical protein [Paenibacillus sp. FSL R10-2734]|uniref:hypothetical protein n=1 Tax=Paenibacillus sp. FSL R10-2734 TaxID=2954691 RepID=UPI0030DA3CB8
MRKKSKSIILVVVIVLLVAIGGCNVWYWNTATGQRTIKNIKSDNTGGMNRVLSVYDQGGNLIRKYEGKIDIQDTEYGNKVLFDLNGKRVVIYNATVVAEEQ